MHPNQVLRFKERMVWHETTVLKLQPRIRKEFHYKGKVNLSFEFSHYIKFGFLTKHFKILNQLFSFVNIRTNHIDNYNNGYSDNGNVMFADTEPAKRRQKFKFIRLFVFYCTIVNISLVSMIKVDTRILKTKQHRIILLP